MNKLRYTFIFLILISLFPCHGLLADEKTNNITENITETVSTSTTENESEENHVNIKPQKKENIFIQIMKWLGFIILIAVIACVIGLFFENLFENLFKKKYKNYNTELYNTELGLGIGIIYFILAIVLKVYFKISFFWSTIIPFSIFPVVCLIVFIIYKRYKAKYYDKIEEFSRILLNANLAMIRNEGELRIFIDDYDDIEFCKKNYKIIRDKIVEIRRQDAEIQRLEAAEEERKIEEFSRILLNANLAMIRNELELYMFIDDYDDIKFCKRNYKIIRDRIVEIRKQKAEEEKQKAEKEKQEAYEQIQNEAAEQTKANEDAMRKNEVERNIDELSDYIDMLGVSIQKKELPDVQVVSVLYKILISILYSKPYITKEGLCKICDDNDAFIEHVLKKCSELENFSGTLLETRMEQVKAKFDDILK